MAAPLLIPTTPLLLLSAQTISATGNSATFALPEGESYAMYLVATTASGTTPVLNGILQTAVDNGTTWVNTGNAFGSLTAAGSSGIVFKPTMGVGQSASAVAPVAGTASGLNQPINQKFMRLNFAVTGTTPSFTYSLYAITTPKGYSVV
jgi:hypothetical protein